MTRGVSEARGTSEANAPKTSTTAAVSPPRQGSSPGGLRRLENALPAAVVALTALLAFRRIEEPDTWWHLAVGRWIAEHRAVPRTEPLSWTLDGTPWIDLPWLFDLFNFGLHQIGGPDLVVIVSAVLYATAVALLLKQLCLVLRPGVAAVTALWAVAIAQGRFTIRPEMASFVFLQIVLLVCSTGRNKAARRWWLLIPVMILWANTHGLFMIGVFIIGCYMAATLAQVFQLVPRAWRSALEPRAARTILLAGTIAMGATLLNPYGLQGTLEPLFLMSVVKGDVAAFQTIPELRPSFSPENVTFAVRAYKGFFFFCVVVVAAACFSSLMFGTARQGRDGSAERRRRRQRQDADVSDRDAAVEARVPLDVAALIVFIGIAYVSTLARRNMALLALGATPFVGQCLSTLGRRWLPRFSTRRTGDRSTAILVVVLFPLIVGAAWCVATNRFYRWDGQFREFGSGILEAMTPVKASAFVRDQQLRPPLFNDWTSGGYLAWDRAVPGGVYIYSAGDSQFFPDYLARLRQPALWQSDADHMGFETVVLFHWWDSHRSLLTSLLTDRRWALVYFDENATVFVRRAGNETAIQQALTAFAPLREKNGQALLGPVSTWQWPIGRARALQAYGNLLEVMGRSGEAVPFFSRLLEIGGASPRDASRAAVRLGHYYLGRGEPERARAFLHRAIDEDSTNPGIDQLRVRLGR